MFRRLLRGGLLAGSAVSFVAVSVLGAVAQETRAAPPRTCFADSAPGTPSAQHPAATLARLAWLSGVWTGAQGPAAVEERWTPAAGGSMLATSRTLRDGRLTAFEFLCIVERNGTLVYSAMPNGRMPPTDFTLTAIDEASATFENPAHDFPKSIRYALRADGALEATIGGASGRPPITFVFTRQ